MIAFAFPSLLTGVARSATNLVMFGRVRALERKIDELTAAVAALAARPAGPDALAVITQALAAASSSQTEMIGTLGDIAIRGAARRMGMRGGASRMRDVERDTKGRMLPSRRRRPQVTSGCALCADPHRQDVTTEMVAAHRAHGSQMQLPRPVEPEVLSNGQGS